MSLTGLIIMTNENFNYYYKQFDQNNYFKTNRVCRYQQPGTGQDTSKIPNFDIGSRSNDSSSHVFPSGGGTHGFSVICITKDGTIRHENNYPKNASVRSARSEKFRTITIKC